MAHTVWRWGFVCACALFALTRAYILFAFQPQASDLSVYFGNAAMVADLGKTPYSHELPIEFPPLAWWTMAAARQVSGAHIAETSSVDLVVAARGAYAQTFRRFMALADLAAFAIFVAIVQRRRPDLVAGAALVYTVCSALLAHVLYDRLDSGVLLLLLATFYCWLRAGDGSGANLWRSSAYFALGLGVAFKIVPILLLPFLLLAEVRRAGSARAAGLALSAAMAGAAIPFGIQSLISGAGVFDLLAFHGGRGVQLESLPATFMALGREFGYGISLELWEGGVNLTGDLAPAMVFVSNVAVAVALGGLGYWFWRKSARDAGDLMCAGSLAIAGTVILSKVLSPQYLIWTIPLLLLAAIEFCRTRRAWWTVAAAVVGIAAITAWLFPNNYFNFKPAPFSLEPLQVSPERLVTSFLIVGVRNLVYLTVVVVLTMRLVRERGARAVPVATSHDRGSGRRSGRSVRLPSGVSDRGPDPVQVQPTNRVRAGRQQR